MDDPITVNSELVVYWTDAYGWSQKTSGIWYGWYPFDPAPNSSVNYFPASEMGWGPGVHAFGVVDGGVGTAYTPDITIDSAPYDVNGVLEQASCTSISGWACDADTPSSGIQVGVYSRTGPGDPFPVLHATGLANLYRNDLAIHYVCGDPSGYHYFNIPTPSSLKDGVTRKLVVYQIVGGPGLLRGVDIPLTCAPPPVTLTVTKIG
ncbi:MAG: hypothetical protein U1D26_03505, partial [Patescibacteria group bacterium]|nr:hypothetical protein [Patescibacteria group bacterium]